MKALSVHPYDAIGIVIGDKTIECRSWETSYRGDILIVSTAKRIPGLIPGYALGVVTLSNIRPFTKKDLRAALMDEYYDNLYAWELTNPRIIKPIPLKGQLRLWEYNGKYEIVEFPDEEPEDVSEARLTELWKPYII